MAKKVLVSVSLLSSENVANETGNLAVFKQLAKRCYEDL